MMYVEKVLESDSIREALLESNDSVNIDLDYQFSFNEEGKLIDLIKKSPFEAENILDEEIEDWKNIGVEVDVSPNVKSLIEKEQLKLVGNDKRLLDRLKRLDPRFYGRILYLSNSGRNVDFMKDLFKKRGLYFGYAPGISFHDPVYSWAWTDDKRELSKDVNITLTPNNWEEAYDIITKAEIEAWELSRKIGY